MIKRFSFTFILELFVCTFLSLAIGYSVEQISLVAILITFIFASFIFYSIFLWRKMRDDDIYEKK